MHSMDERKGDQAIRSVSSRHNEMMTNAFPVRGEQSGTIKDVARLAGVSVATVSRVTNGACNVSGETRTKVLNVISTLKYCPNAHAAELGRAKDGTPKRRGNHNSALARGRVKTTSNPGVDVQEQLRKTGRSLFPNGQYLQVMRLIANLSMDLEKLRRIIEND